MDFICHRHPCPPTSAVAEITSDPDCFDPDIERSGQDAFEIGAAACSGVAIAEDSLHSDLHATAAYRAALTRLHKAGDFAGAAREFGRWNRAGGRVLAGLTRRRAAEAKLYRGG